MMRTKLGLGVLGSAGALVAGIGAYGGSAEAQGSAGQAGFSANCAACHQEDGKGVEGAFPALVGNAFLLGPEEQPIGLLLKGRGAMPSFAGELKDDQIAQILSYARSAWGNKGAPVANEAVAKVRAAGG